MGLPRARPCPDREHRLRAGGGERWTFYPTERTSSSCRKSVNDGARVLEGGISYVSTIHAASRGGGRYLFMPRSMNSSGEPLLADTGGRPLRRLKETPPSCRHNRRLRTIRRRCCGRSHPPLVPTPQIEFTGWHLRERPSLIRPGEVGSGRKGACLLLRNLAE